MGCSLSRLVGSLQLTISKGESIPPSISFCLCERILMSLLESYVHLWIYPWVQEAGILWLACVGHMLTCLVLLESGGMIRRKFWKWKNVGQMQNWKLCTMLVNYLSVLSKNVLFINSKQIRRHLVNHQLSLDISLLFLHSLVVFFPSILWVMSWRNTNGKDPTLLSVFSWSSSGRQPVNSARTSRYSRLWYLLK